MENQDGKRVARGPGMPRGGKIALAVVLVLVLALAGGYVGLCAYAGSSAFLPNTSIAGVDVSGQSREGATAALEGALPGLLADSRAEFTCAGQSYAVNGDDPSVSVDAAAAVDAALTDQAGSFFTRGRRYLAAVMHGNRCLRPRDTDRHAGRGNPGGGGVLRPGGPDHLGGHRHRAGAPQGGHRPHH